MIFASRRFLPVLFLAAAACAAPPISTPSDGWLRPAGAPEENIVLLSAGEAVEIDVTQDRLTEEQAVTLALRHSPSLQVALGHLAAAAAEAEHSRLWPNPLLDVALRIPEGGGAARWDLGLSAALGALLNRPGRVEVADTQLHAAAASALAVACQEAARAREAFAEVVLSDALLPLSARSAELALESLQAVQRRRTLGEAGTAELIGAEAAVARADATVARARADASLRRTALSARLGSPLGAAAWEIQAPPLPAELPEEAAWTRSAQIRNPAVLRAEALAAASTAAAAIAGAPLRDGLEAGVSAERDLEWGVGPALSVPLPLFDDGSARRDQAVARATAAAHEVVLERRLAVASARSAWQELRAASQSREQLLSTAFPPLETELARARASLQAGETSPSVVIAAEAALLALRIQLHSLDRDLRVSHARLVLASGGTPQPEFHSSQ